MEMEKMLSNKSLPDYVFNKRFEKFVFAIFSETNHNQIVEFMQILCSLSKDANSEKLFSFEIAESRIIPIKEFDLSSEAPGKIAEFFKNYEDENGIPHFLFVAFNIFFVDEKQSFGVYADRHFDVSIVGCSVSVYDKLLTKQGGLRFLKLDEYLAWIKKWIAIEKFTKIEKSLIRNYS